MRKIACATVVLVFLAACKPGTVDVASSVQGVAGSKDIECIGAAKGTSPDGLGGLLAQNPKDLCRGFYRLRVRGSGTDQKIALYGASTNGNSSQTWKMVNVTNDATGITYVATNTPNGKVTLQINSNGEVPLDPRNLFGDDQVAIQHCLNDTHRSYRGTAGKATFLANMKPVGSMTPYTLQETNLPMICATMK